MVLGLGDRLRGPVLVDGSDLELLEDSARYRGAASRSARSVLSCAFVAHGGVS